MFTAHASRTSASLKRVVADTEISLRRASKREAVVSPSQTWNLAHEARKRRDEAKEERRKAKAIGLGLPKDATVTAIEQQQARVVRRDREAVNERTRALALNPDDSRRTVRWIINQVARENGLLPEVILGRSRHRFYVAVRHQAMVRAYLAFPNMSLGWLGRHFNRDHTSFLHAIQKSGHWQPRQKSES